MGAKPLCDSHPFEIYTILGRLGFAANRLSGLLTGGCMILFPITFQNTVLMSLRSVRYYLLACVLFPQDQRGMYIKRLMPTFFGLLYVPFLLHYFVRILDTDPIITGEFAVSFGLFFCLWIVIVAKFSDMGALLIGKAFGRTKMAPSISPGKTIEGLLGGFLASAGIGALIPWLISEYAPNFTDLSVCSFSALDGGLWGLLIALVAVIGDLIASVLKRLAGIKDSGGAIPGIGGMLDLTDSLILAAPTGYFILQIIKS